MSAKITYLSRLSKQFRQFLGSFSFRAILLGAGQWVLAPEVGFLWTPPSWAWSDGAFVFYESYWGPDVGFCGESFTALAILALSADVGAAIDSSTTVPS